MKTKIMTFWSRLKHAYITRVKIKTAEHYLTTVRQKAQNQNLAADITLGLLVIITQ